MSGYGYYRERDCTSCNNIQITENSSPRACSILCDGKSFCKGYTYEITTRRCYLKKTASTRSLVRNSYRVLYVKRIDCKYFPFELDLQFFFKSKFFV